MVGKESDYYGLDHNELVGIYLSGVIAGLVPLFLVLVMTNNNFMYFMMLLPYMWGCMPDVVKSIDNLKSMRI